MPAPREGKASTIADSKRSTSESSSNKRKRWRPNFDYDVDYNDHFETPQVAYRHILPILDSLFGGERQKNRQWKPVAYDPYYCDGQAGELLRNLGIFSEVAHAKRDFYRDVREGSVPKHDVLITNPPYSEDHKERCLEYCVAHFREHSTPFFLLMPNYVASKGYYKTILEDVLDDVVYVLPHVPYEYQHPEGTGHELPPFQSLWFCCVGRTRIPAIRQLWDQSAPQRLYISVDALRQDGAIPTEKRPNPRQRRKKKQNDAGEKEPLENIQKKQEGLAKNKARPTSGQASVKKSKKSKYRDGQGQRKKKRF